MSIHSVLLRLFLILVLLLDGTATAMASAVHMNYVGMTTTAAQVESTANADKEGEMPCHDADANEAKIATATDSGDHGAPDIGTPTPDCCEGACDCACVHPVHAAVVAAMVSVGSIEHSDSVRPMFSVHASPALPHLIRPPIG